MEIESEQAGTSGSVGSADQSPSEQSDEISDTVPCIVREAVITIKIPNMFERIGHPSAYLNVCDAPPSRTPIPRKADGNPISLGSIAIKFAKLEELLYKNKAKLELEPPQDCLYKDWLRALDYAFKGKHFARGAERARKFDEQDQYEELLRDDRRVAAKLGLEASELNFQKLERWDGAVKHIDD